MYKQALIIALIVVMVGALWGCAPNPRYRYTTTGATVGAASGAAIGGLFGPEDLRGTNALVGAGAGLFLGTVVGNMMDRAEWEREGYYYEPERTYRQDEAGNYVRAEPRKKYVLGEDGYYYEVVE
jgi:uncharacterized protein YcfJ